MPTEALQPPAAFAAMTGSPIVQRLINPLQDAQNPQLAKNRPWNDAFGRSIALPTIVLCDIGPRQMGENWESSAVAAWRLSRNSLWRAASTGSAENAIRRLPE
jgi:hypothetical protein